VAIDYIFERSVGGFGDPVTGKSKIAVTHLDHVTGLTFDQQ
jgi:hypothetical protein